MYLKQEMNIIATYLRFFRLAQANVECEEIAEHLNKIQMEHIGLPSDLEKNTRIANILFSWAEYLGSIIT